MSNPQNLTSPGCFPDQISAYPGPYSSSPAIPLGDWHVMGNGRIYTLTIISESGGVVQARLSSGDVTDAKWNASEQKLTFKRIIPGVVEQEWIGYVMAYDAKDLKWRMAGTLRNLTAPLVTAGFYATLPR